MLEKNLAEPLSSVDLTADVRIKKIKRTGGGWTFTTATNILNIITTTDYIIAQQRCIFDVTLAE